MEIWKGIDGYNGLYEVSDLGRVRRNGKLLCASLNPRNGYLSVMLCKDGKPKRVYVHRLVGQSFLENNNNLREINHKDENKKNNRADNLEWCDHKYNSFYGENAPAKSRERPIIQKTLDGEIISVWGSAQKAARKTGVLRQSIGKCCLGKRKSAGGFMWQFA